MSTFLTFRNISFATADGRNLFRDISLSFGRERTGFVGRNGSGKTTLLKLALGELAPASGTVTCDGTIGILRQDYTAMARQTVAGEIGAASELERIERILAGTGSDEDIEKADWQVEARLENALTKAGLTGIHHERELGSLSGGQRTRVAIARLIYAGPDLLLLDEPTNNLDREGREAILAFLESWSGGAIVSSHDRELLCHMDRIVELSDLGASLYGGNWDIYREFKDAEVAAAESDYARAVKDREELEKRSREALERQARKNAAGKRSRADAGMSKLALDARKDRAGKTSGRLGTQSEKMLDKAKQELTQAQSRLEKKRGRDFSIEAAEQSAGRQVVVIDNLTGGPPGAENLIEGLSFVIAGRERIAVVGRNGSGKTTLLKLITGAQTPVSGMIRRYGKIAFLDQDVELLERDRTILENYRRWNPEGNDNACRSALARFLFRAEAVHQLCRELSGGERLRAGLACILGGVTPPDLLILDEPTNHLDLESIEAMEKALNSYAGALLVVSHDESFLEAIGIERRLVLGE